MPSKAGEDFCGRKSKFDSSSAKGGGSIGLIWNDKEQRLRAPWRLMLQAFVFVGILFVLGVPISYLLVEKAGMSDLTYAQMSREAIANPATLALMTVAGLIAAIVSTFVAATFVDGRPVKSMGLQMDNAWWADLKLGLALGVAGVGLVFLIQWAAGWMRVTGSGAVEGSVSDFVLDFVFAGLVFASIGIYEELLSRGYQLTNLAEGLTHRRWGSAGGVIGAVVISSAFFGLLHFFNPAPTPLALLNVALTGLLIFGPAYVLTGRLGLPMGFHISWNFAQSFIFGMPVSGMQIGEYPLLMTVATGPLKWTGGSFGPEGGLLGTLVIILAAAVILLWIHRRYGRLQIHNNFYSPPQTAAAPTPPDAPDEWIKPSLNG